MNTRFIAYPIICCLILLHVDIGWADQEEGKPADDLPTTTSPRFRVSASRWLPVPLSPPPLVPLSSDTVRTKANGFGNRLLHDLHSALRTTASDIRHIYTTPARMELRHALWVGGILTVGGVLFAYDQELYDALKRNQSDRYYRPIRKAGEFFEPLGYMGFTNKYLFAALFLGYLAGSDPVVEVSSDILEHFLVASIGKNLMMNLAGRRGPMVEEGARSFDFGEGRSFPSGHSLAITQLATVLAHHIRYRPFQIAIYGTAGTVLLQRITSDHHWPSDVYGGALYGWLISRELLKRKENRRIRITPLSREGTGLGLSFGL